jgi:hypothetical protein
MFIVCLIFVCKGTKKLGKNKENKEELGFFTFSAYSLQTSSATNDHSNSEGVRGLRPVCRSHQAKRLKEQS